MSVETVDKVHLFSQTLWQMLHGQRAQGNARQQHRLSPPVTPAVAMK
jgi:hypothetical protein